MVSLAAFNTNFANGGLQTQTYTDSRVLAANVPEIFTVPTNNDGLKANYVIFGKPSAGDFFVEMFSADSGTDRVTNGTFAEYVTNGAFASDTGWTKGTGWTIGAGVATATTASSDLSQTLAITLIPGYTYTITYTVTRSAGSVTPILGGNIGTPRSTSATFTETIVATAGSTLAFTGTGFTGTIDNVSITGWVLGTGWTTDGTTAIATGAISTALSQTANSAYPLVTGQAYLVTYTATRSAGTVTVSIGGTAGTARSTSATFAEVIIAGATQAISFGTSGFTGTIDDVTIIPAASTPGDASSGYSGEQNPPGFFLNGSIAAISIVSAGTPIVTASYYKQVCMTITARQIIKKAMQKGGILIKNEDPDADEANDALDTLNATLSSISNDALNIYARTWQFFTLSGGIASYTIGTGQDLNTSRPLQIVDCYLRNDTIDNPMTVVPDEFYDSIELKTVQGIPYWLNYNNDYPTGIIRLFPVPSADYQLFLLMEKPLNNFPTLDTVMVLPDGWQRALIYSLAVELAPEYGQQVDPVVVELAKQSMGKIKTAVARVRTMDAYAQARTGNIYNGWYY